MSKSNAFENDLLLLLFNNTDIAGIGDATGLRGSSAAGHWYFALHTAEVAEGDAQSASEAAYTSYTRMGVARSAGGFTVTGNTVTLVSDVSFPEATGGTETLTHFSVGYASSGASKVAYKGALDVPISVAAGVTPKLKAATNITED